MANIVYNEDCMIGMARYPDKYFDLAIVDPPYGVGCVTYMPRSRETAFGGYIDKYDITVATLDMNQRDKSKVNVVHANNTEGSRGSFGDNNVSPSPMYFEELFRVSANQIIWGGNYFILPPSRGFIVWRKTTVHETFSMAMCEYAWVSFNSNSKIYDGAPQGTTASPRIHPTQKPIALYDWILKLYAKPTDKILDTHVGSGSSRIAADKHKIDFTGFEIDAEYWQAQESRFERYKAQGVLF